MFTQTAIAAAITTVGTVKDPSGYVADISGVVAHYSAGIEKGNADISDVMEMASGIKAILSSIDTDIAELQGYVVEAKSEHFTLTPEDAKSVVGSLGELSVNISNAVKTLSNISLIVGNLKTFYPHQGLLDSVLFEGVDKYGVMQQGINSIVDICEGIIRSAQKVEANVSGDKDRIESLRKEKFENALSRVASNNYETLKALADK